MHTWLWTSRDAKLGKAEAASGKPRTGAGEKADRQAQPLREPEQNPASQLYLMPNAENRT